MQARYVRYDLCFEIPGRREVGKEEERESGRGAERKAGRGEEKEQGGLAGRDGGKKGRKEDRE